MSGIWRPFDDNDAVQLLIGTLRASFLDRSMSVVRCASCVVRRQQFALKAYSSNTLGLIESGLGRKHWGKMYIIDS